MVTKSLILQTAERVQEEQEHARCQYIFGTSVIANGT